jgi:hypothetical protein
VGYRLVFNKVLACLILGAILGALFSSPAMAASSSDFGSGWIPKPLVDPNASTVQQSKPVAGPSASSVADAELEKALKPAEPFIRDVEGKLLINPTTGPKSGASLVSRLNTIQTVLFGEAKYKDAGEVLAKIAELFPQEAAKAHAELARQMNPPTAAATKPGTIMMMKGPSSGGQPFGGQGAGNFQALPPVDANQKPVVTAPLSSAQVSSQASPKFAPKDDSPLPAQTKKRRFWQSDWDEDPFKNDPFFKDSFFNERSTTSPSLFQSSVQTTGQPPVQSSAQSYGQPSGQSSPQSPGSKLQGLGSGLLGLAALAGSVAGNYYANKKWGGVANNQANQYPYGYAPYGQGYPYGYPYGAYPSGQVYGYGSPYYGQPVYSYGPAYTPYDSTTSAISPLGYPY